MNRDERLPRPNAPPKGTPDSRESCASQGGKAAAALNAALIGAVDGDDEETVEDTINVIMGQRKMRPNASYFLHRPAEEQDP
jgi:hypothetical protein